FFFFSCSTHTRDLHSFPTRRSSDLSVPPSPPIENFAVLNVCAGPWRGQARAGTRSNAATPSVRLAIHASKSTRGAVDHLTSVPPLRSDTFLTLRESPSHDLATIITDMLLALCVLLHCGDST